VIDEGNLEKDDVEDDGREVVGIVVEVVVVTCVDMEAGAGIKDEGGGS